ncbi:MULTISPECIES: hypothetical protein [unclassified Nostoc]|uniref:hypothetical protein n=1 Tax=unclassified Nostoc TaxID=2593658 RepID=UPI00262C0F3A|nr:hypothetical protein [Nostoc sp. S13]MDF5736620.1 hypothetical protein [Nostoc sp. S13]
MMKKLMPPSSAQKFLKNIKNREQIESLHDNDSIPPELVTWLARLKLLHGVPFHYLVPHEKMLPQESIRFFQVDLNWLKCLLEGALSLGNTTQGDQDHRQALSPTIHKQAHQEATALRQNMILPNASKIHSRSQHNSEQPLSGFLLRSAVVSGWPGLEIEAYPSGADTEDPNQKLKILRMERLSDNIVLCLFEGILQNVFIHEPTEGLHFGVDIDENLKLYKELWEISSDPNNSQIKVRKEIEKNGQRVTINSQEMNECIRDNKKKVLKVSQLKQKIVDKLRDAGINEEFTSAEFALQMVEGVQNVKFSTQ